MHLNVHREIKVYTWLMWNKNATSVQSVFFLVMFIAIKLHKCWEGMTAAVLNTPSVWEPWKQLKEVPQDTEAFCVTSASRMTSSTLV